MSEFGVYFCVSFAVRVACVADVSRAWPRYDLRISENVSFEIEVVFPQDSYQGVSLTLAETCPSTFGKMTVDKLH
jgi:hypothetical protein